jgi:hypothetical protein
MHSLTKNKKQGTRIGSLPRRRCDVQEFDILWFIDAEVHALHLIINTRNNGRVRHLYVHLSEGFLQRTSHGDFILLPIIQALNLYFLFHIFQFFWANLQKSFRNKPSLSDIFIIFAPNL